MSGCNVCRRSGDNHALVREMTRLRADLAAAIARAERAEDSNELLRNRVVKTEGDREDLRTENARLTRERDEALARAERAESSLAAAVEQAGDMQLLANEQEMRAIRAEAELARMRPVLEDNHERFARERGQD